MPARRHATLKLRMLAALGVACAVAGMPPATAAEPAAGCLPVVRDAWLRLSPAGMPMLGGFARIENRCRAAASIVTARSPAFASVRLHETRVVDGISRMRPVPALRIPPGARVSLEPGGLHLMLAQPVRMPVAGDAVRVEFELDDGRTVRGVFTVRAADAR